MSMATSLSPWLVPPGQRQNLYALLINHASLKPHPQRYEVPSTNDFDLLDAHFDDIGWPCDLPIPGSSCKEEFDAPNKNEEICALLNLQ